MGKSHSSDLRRRLAAMVASGQSRRAAARQFHISESAAITLLLLRNWTGTLAPFKRDRPAYRGKLAAYSAFLIGQVLENPDITMPEVAARLERPRSL